MSAPSSRRSFLRTPALAGGGSMLSLRLVADAAGGGTGAPASAAFGPNGYVRIDPTDRSPSGRRTPTWARGSRRRSPMILAEEMDADWSRVQAMRRGTEPRAVRRTGLRRQRQHAATNGTSTATRVRPISRDAGGHRRRSSGACREPNAAPKEAVVHTRRRTALLVSANWPRRGGAHSARTSRRGSLIARSR